MVYSDLDHDGFYSVGEGVGNAVTLAGVTEIAGIESDQLMV